MDSKEIRGLMEAYAEVYAPQEEIQEAVKGASLHTMQMRQDAAAERRAGIKPLPAKEGEKYAKYKMAQMAYSKRKREMDEDVEQVDEAIYSEKGKAKAAEMIAKRSTPSGRAKPGKGANVAQIRQIRGSGRGDFDKEGLGGTPMTPTMAKNPRKKQNYTGTGNKAARRAGLTPTREKPNAWKEEFDIFDVVLEFLQAEGYAETLEEAEWMMANVIDEEAIDIILGEEQLDEISDRKVQGLLRKRGAQDKDSGGISAGYMANRRAQQAAARRNVRTGSNVKVDPILSKEEYVDEAQVANRDPDKYEREQEKKSAPVRGERTPMPPRGDRRREDFEKWYAKQMGR